MPDPTEYFRNKISDILYVITGQRNHDPNVSVFLETAVKEHLQSIVAACDAEKKKRPKAKAINEDDLFNALRGSPEYYGARRCLVLKQLGRKWSNLEGDDSIIDEVDEEEQDDGDNEDSDPTDTLESDPLSILTSLYDDTPESQEFQRILRQILERADSLTKSMDAGEYLEYSKFAKTKFIDKKPLFCQWLASFKRKPNPKLYTLYGWLATFFIRKHTMEALQKRFHSTAGLFMYDTIHYDKNHPLNITDFQKDCISNTTPPQSDLQFILQYDCKYIQRKTRHSEFPIPNQKATIPPLQRLRYYQKHPRVHLFHPYLAPGATSLRNISIPYGDTSLGNIPASNSSLRSC